MKIRLKPLNSSLALSFTLHASLIAAALTSAPPSSHPLGNAALGEVTMVELAGAPSLSNGKKRASANNEALIQTKSSPRSKKQESQAEQNQLASDQETSETENSNSDFVQAGSSDAETSGTESSGTGGQGIGSANGSRDGDGRGPIGDPHGREVSALERYLFELRRYLENRKTYPALSRQLGETGRVVIRLLIAKDGDFSQATVIASSAPPRLVAAAEQLLRSSRNFKPLPVEHSSDQLSVEIPIDYVLR